jgi:hypothetical protein
MSALASPARHSLPASATTTPHRASDTVNTAVTDPTLPTLRTTEELLQILDPSTSTDRLKDLAESDIRSVERSSRSRRVARGSGSIPDEVPLDESGSHVCAQSRSSVSDHARQSGASVSYGQDFDASAAVAGASGTTVATSSKARSVSATPSASGSPVVRRRSSGSGSIVDLVPGGVRISSTGKRGFADGVIGTPGSSVSLRTPLSDIRASAKGEGHTAAFNVSAAMHLRACLCMLCYHGVCTRVDMCHRRADHT